MNTPFVVGLGGTLKADSSTERAVRMVLRIAEERGAQTRMFAGADLNLPFYEPLALQRSEGARALVDALRRADAVVIGSPGYHGGVAGIIKNALDYVEDMSGDARPYFDGRPVGCIATGAGWQGAASTLASLRSIVHALRGWPTPLGVIVNTRTPAFDAQDNCLQEGVREQLSIMADQLIGFGRISSISAA